MCGGGRVEKKEEEEEEQEREGGREDWVAPAGGKRAQEAALRTRRPMRSK